MAGRIVGDRYQLKQVIGEGAFSQVYAAHHIHINRPVAVKLLVNAFAADPEAADLLLREARIIGSLGHPGICEALDAGVTEEGIPYLVLELLRGRTLFEELSAVGRFDAKRAIDLGAQLASALGSAHQKGIIHRDLKPENIFLVDGSGRSDVAKILDFGIARVSFQAASSKGAAAPAGTPGYMAPEAITQPGQVDARLDIYAWGATLYHVLSGEAPFAGYKIPEIFTAMLTREPRPLRELRPDLPPRLVQIIERAMHREPTQRYAAMTEVGAALAELTDGFTDTLLPSQQSSSGVRRSPTTQPPQPTSPSRLGWLLAALAGAVALGGWAWLRRDTNPNAGPAVTTVVLEVHSGPPQALVLFRGRSLPVPFKARFDRGSRDELLEISAPGYDTRQLWIVLDQDLALGAELLATKPPTAAMDLAPLNAAVSATAAMGTKTSLVAGKARPAVTLRPPISAGAEMPAPPPLPPSPVVAVKPTPVAAPAPVVASIDPALPEPNLPKVAPTLKPEQLAADASRQIVASHRSMIDDCVAKDPSVGGRFVVHVRANPAGQIESLEVVEASASTVVERCLVARVKSWNLGQRIGGTRATLAIDLE